MYRFCTMDEASVWDGYAMAVHATSDEERMAALLSVAEGRYLESLAHPLDRYFPEGRLKQMLSGADALELGSNFGGASLAYYELYGLKSITGIDVREDQPDICRAFFRKHGVDEADYDFRQGVGENLPFADGAFDVVLSFDVIEHVQDVRRTLAECWRVLKPGGHCIHIFPSFWHPVQHHLTLVTRAPFIHWIYSKQTLMDVYWDILDENPEYRDRNGVTRRPLHDWERLFIINGTSQRGFESLVRSQDWHSIEQFPVPLGSVGKVVSRHPWLRILCCLTAPACRLPVFREFANQRIVSVLTK